MGVGPFAQRGLDEALRFAIGFWRVRFGAQVLDFEQAQCLGVATGSEAGTIVGHDALNLDAMGPEEAQRVEEKAQAGAALFVRQDFRVSHAGVIVYRQMQIFPANTAAVALTFAIAGDAVTDLLETTELFDIDVDDLARVLALVAAHRFGRLQGRELVGAEPLQDAADGRRRRANLYGDLLAGVALPAQSLNGGARGRHCSVGNERGLEERSRKPSMPPARNRSTHLATGLRCDVELARGGGFAQSRLHTPHHRLSTFRRREHLMAVSGLSGETELRNLSFLGSDRMDNLLKDHS